MRHTAIDQSRVLIPGDDFYRKSKDVFGLRNEVGGILSHAQRVGADRAHCFAWQATQALGKTPQCYQCLLLHFGIQKFVSVKSGGKTYRFTQSVQHVELVTLDPRNLQTEAVRTEIYCGEDGMLHYSLIS